MPVHMFKNANYDLNLLLYGLVRTFAYDKRKSKICVIIRQSLCAGCKNTAEARLPYFQIQSA